MIMIYKDALLIAISLLPRMLKIPLFRLVGYRIGQGVKIGLLCLLDVQNSATIGNNAKIGPMTIIRAKDFSIGSNSSVRPFTYIQTPRVSIGQDSIISSGVIVRSGHVSEYSSLLIGDIVHIFPFVTIDCSRVVEIQDGTGIGPKCNIYTHSSYKSVLEGYKVTYGNVSIGKRVELTYNVFVAPGITIGDDSICAYGSYVNQDIPEGVLAAGMPAVIKRTRVQVTGGASSIDAKMILTNIIREYQKCIKLVNGRSPLPIELCVEDEICLDQDGYIYLLYNSTILKTESSRYGLFDIDAGTCVNKGMKPVDFVGFRKFLSRYGIRFLTMMNI